MHAFITGATGFIGSHVTMSLLQQGWKVTALCRDKTQLANSAVMSELNAAGTIKWKRGDILNLHSLRRAMPARVDAIFHLAGDTTTWDRMSKRQYHVNVIGTQNVAKVALEKKAIRFIHTSSTVVFGDHDETIDEFSEMRGMDSPVSYFRTKFLAEEVIRENIKKGLDAVILNPSIVIGPHDRSNWRLLFDAIQSDCLKGVPTGTKAFCYVEDVAKAHVQAFIHGRCGENYLLSGPHAELINVCHWISQRLNKHMPSQLCATWQIKLLATWQSIKSRFTRKEPALTPERAHILCSHTVINSDKSHRELNYKNTKTIDEMLETTYQWWIHQQAGDLLAQQKKSAA